MLPQAISRTSGQLSGRVVRSLCLAALSRVRPRDSTSSTMVAATAQTSAVGMCWIGVEALTGPNRMSIEKCVHSQWFPTRHLYFKEVESALTSLNPKQVSAGLNDGAG